MRVREAAQKYFPTPVSDLKARVLDYLEQHEDEVFTYRDDTLLKALDVKQSTLSWVLWWLYQNRYIDREEVGRRMFFGAYKAIAELRRTLGRDKADAFARAKANAERIRARAGDIGVVELLDAVREDR